MPIIASAKGGGNFVNAPQGVHPAVCVDVVDMGMVKNERYGKEEHKIRIVWQIDKRMDSGSRFIANRRFTNSLSEKSHLLPFLQNWRGQSFSAAELKGFDLENLLGANAMLQIIHTEDNGQTYANVTAAFPIQPGQPKMVAENYTRVQDRDKGQGQPPRADMQPPKPHPSEWKSNQPLNDDDIPF